MNVPKLRFKDEDGREFAEWNTASLGDVAFFSKGKAFQKLTLTQMGIRPALDMENFTLNTKKQLGT